jgi:hypothetical protein
VRSPTDFTDLSGGAIPASLTPRLLGPLLALLLGCSPARYSTEPDPSHRLDSERNGQQGPTLVFPGHYAEGSPQAPPSSAPFASAVPPASSAAPSAAAPTPSKLPDPTPLEMAEQVEYDLELAEGKIRAVSVKPIRLPKPVATPRRLGRYALELSIGRELIERVRFDFPGTAADEPVPGRKKLDAPLDLSSRAIARVKLLVPHSPRVRRALLVDRALNSVQELEWPLPAPPPKPVAVEAQPPQP